MQSHHLPFSPPVLPAERSWAQDSVPDFLWDILSTTNPVVKGGLKSSSFLAFFAAFCSIYLLCVPFLPCLFVFLFHAGAPWFPFSVPSLLMLRHPGSFVQYQVPIKLPQTVALMQTSLLCSRPVEWLLPLDRPQASQTQEVQWGLPWWRSGWESACQCRGHGFEPWSGNIPHAAEQLGPWATIAEPAHLEPVLRNKRGRDSERLVQRDEEWPPLAATRESSRTETNTQHSQKNKTNKQKEVQWN